MVWNRRVLVAAAAVLAVLAGGAGITPAQADPGPADPVALVDAADDSDLADVLGCNRTPSPAAAAELFSTGTMRLVPFGAVKLPVDGNINWAISPFRHASWESRFRDLRCLEVRGAKYRNVATRLHAKRIRNTWQSFDLRDRAYGVQRTRNVLFAQRPDIAVVYDRTAASAKKRTFRQLWHLAADLRVTRKERGVAVASSPGGARLWLIPVSLDGSRRGEGTSVVTGQTSPTQGWVSERMLERSPAPVVTMTSRGRAARMLTVLVPAGPGSTVKTATRRLAKGVRLLTVTVDGRSYRFRIAAGGTLTRV